MPSRRTDSRVDAQAARLAIQAPAVEIAYKKFVLSNGLTLLVHEDHKAPIVAVNVWYHVGSKNEKPGKTGFAHLFEHLMFNGSEHFDDDYFQALERIGATDLNGTTNEDRTNYFQNVPAGAFETVLWLESDRMGHMVGAITQAKLDEQRGVVKNEKRQYENEPYGIAEEMIVKGTFPPGHPYSWTVIGSMEDIDGASLADVHAWFRDYYGAANAVLSIAGAIDADVAFQSVQKYFGNIAPGSPVTRHHAWVAKRTGTTRQVAQDRVPQARIYKIWNVPQWSSEEADLLELAARVLSIGKSSRLFERLVYRDQIATSVDAAVDAREIASHFRIEATARPGGNLGEVERALNEELERFLEDGPTERELERVKTGMRAEFTRGVERIGGFGGKSDILAVHQVLAGDPEHYKASFERTQAASGERILETARKWLSDGAYVLEIHPLPEQRASGADADRTKAPEPRPSADPKFPRTERATLSNGLKVIFAARRAVPVIEIALMIDAGYAADPAGAMGTATLTMGMLDEGTGTRSSLEISDDLSLLGGELDAGSNLDMSVVKLSALKDRLDPSLELFAEIILDPAFPEAELERLRKQQLASIAREKAAPVPMALRVLPRLLYGAGHPYGNPFTGSGTESSVARISRDDLVGFHRNWFDPRNCTLVVVGDTTLDEILPRLEALFRGWSPGVASSKAIGGVALPERSSVYLLDRPGSIQTLILAGHVAPPRNNPDELAIESMNAVLGGLFTSRLNMNLREDKHWAYGAGSFLPGARGPRPFLVYAPIQADKTREAMAEILSELRSIRDDRPPTADELGKVQSNFTLTLPGSWETAESVASAISEVVAYGLPADYHDTYASRVRALTTADLAAAARKVLHPEQMTWVVVGDRTQIQKSVEDAALGELHFVDADGNPSTGGEPAR